MTPARSSVLTGTQERPQILALLGLALVALCLRVPDFGNPVIHVDEQYYLLVGDRMLHGALPYVDIWDRKPIGLFAIYAAIRLLPGNGIVAYQFVAAIFAIATAWLVHTASRRLGARPIGAFAAGCIYLVWLPLFSGRAGESPVFFNAFMTAAALLALRLPDLAVRRATGAITANGALVCLLAGLAIQTKYTPAVEGAFFGLVHIHYLRKAGVRRGQVAAAAALWLLLGLAPTLAAIAVYWAKGPAFLQAFWFANFGSILRRGAYSYPAAVIAGRLAGTVAKLLPLIICAILVLRSRPRDPRMQIMAGWAAAALIGYTVLGTYFDHYALPLVAPFAILSASILGRRPIAALSILAAGTALFLAEMVLEPTGDAVGAYDVAHVVRLNSRGACPYIFVGDVITYHLAAACLPTPYAFPSMLAYAPEQGALGINPAREVRRILAGRPPVIVTSRTPLAAWNVQTQALVNAALARDYRLVFRAGRADYCTLVFLRDDLRYVRSTSASNGDSAALAPARCWE